MDKNKKISLSIDVFFERGGTVFQTAAYYAVVIPRLRPGLLSLRSVLPSRQICCLVVWLFCCLVVLLTEKTNN